MNHFHIIVLGKLKESYWRQAEAEYLKRLQPFAKVFIHEIKEETLNDKTDPALIKQKEAQKIVAALSKIKNSTVIVLDENQTQLSSVKFSEFIGTQTKEQTNNLVFVLGGPLGLDQSIILSAKNRLSLSKMTFTHQMARVILLEQLYRAMMIAHHRTYHY